MEIEEQAIPSGKNFWIGFAVGWTAYFLVVLSFEAPRTSGDIAEAARTAFLLLLPFVVTTGVVSFNRRRLLSPEWSLGQTLKVHALVGLAFSVTTAALMHGVSYLFEIPSEMAGGGPWLNFLFSMIASAFLYAMFLGFLMWAESIRRVFESQTAFAREAALRAEAEAKAVRAQFNPHFVFNTLHSLMLLVRADPTAAEQAIEDVATLIRYASILQRRDIDAVPLAKELEVARRYVGLEQLRLADRLDVSWDVEAGVEMMSIPAFSLQTLVENAIKHGVEARTGPGRVSIRVERTGDVVRAVVSDDGPGTDPDLVRKEGHGLDLLGRRISARYGEQGVLKWTTAPGEGFAVELRVPAERSGPQPDLAVIPGSGGPIVLRRGPEGEAAARAHG
jgi:signal transduction histidine kinase